MKSMTGFGKATFQSSDFLLDVSIRAVNGRFLDIKFHGPKHYTALESEVRKRVAKYIRRGTVDVYLTRKVFNGSDKVVFNQKLAKKWLSGFKTMAKELKLDMPQSSEILLSVPELVKVEEANQVSAKEKKCFIQVLDQALEACSQVRDKEGAGLKKDIQSHLNQLGRQGAKIRKLREATKKDLHKKYEKKLQAYQLTESFDENRLAQELVILLDKSDIAEEIQRLEAHLVAVNALIRTSGSIGKKLDFYAQELLREVNTIGSKSTRSELTQEVIEAKSFIEKYREQVQNVE